MKDEHFLKLADLLNPDIWKDPQLSIQQMLNYYKSNFEIRPALGTGNIAVPCPPDYRKVANSILRAGEVLSKDVKKQYGIHASSKVTTSIFEHFTDEGLSDCIEAAKLLGLAIEGIEITLERIENWKKSGKTKVEFMADSWACDICKKVKGIYAIEKTPIPVLDTHIGCTCNILVAG